jgi:hypothetical protein
VVFPSKEKIMALKPGQDSGKAGGIYQEKGPRGGLKDNFSTIADNKTAPPTQNPNSTWVPVKKTPDSKR